ncbi:hypothetical protein Taro_012847, partial [Colocasia esculenta]|nr:hypothetical protein [Colocasia esculenta]
LLDNFQSFQISLPAGVAAAAMVQVLGNMERVAQVLLFLAVAAVPALAANYDIDWSNAADYSSWASGKSIQTGDTVTFKYGVLHSVYEVSQADYAACGVSNSINSYSDGNTVITLDKPGTRYFVCGALGHCGLGMKIAIPISAASTTPSTPAAAGSTPVTPSTLSSAGKQPSSPSAAAIFHPVKGFIAGAVLVGVAVYC